MSDQPKASASRQYHSLRRRGRPGEKCAKFAGAIVSDPAIGPAVYQRYAALHRNNMGHRELGNGREAAKLIREPTTARPVEGT